MSNSPLVSYTLISPNKNSPRNHKIDTITIHCVVGQLTAEGICACFTSPSVGASCNYGIGTDGRIALCVDEGDRSWCSSSSSNDNRAVTIECASDKTHPYAINDAVYKSLIKLCADICKRNGIKELKWKADKSLIGQVDKQNMTVHRWFANKACPGDYIYNRLGQIADEVNALLGVKTTNKKTQPKTAVKASGLQATDLRHLSEEETINKVGPSCTADMKKSGILASVTLAQFVLESGYGKTDLAQNANNCFGMKKKLSGNSWSGSTWDGKSIYTKNTKEFVNEQYITVPADFRKYPCIEDSIADHSAYLLGAKNGSKLRYAGLKGCTDYKKAISIIKNGGYATDPNYVSKICSIIERFNLTKFDEEMVEVSDVVIDDEPVEEESWYRVRLKWENQNSQLGAFHNLDLAKKCADEHSGYSVFDNDGKLVYTGKNTAASSDNSFKVKVTIDNLNIRTGPGKGYTRVQFIEPGVYTIVGVKPGLGSKSGWGKLKSGVGWISLDHVVRTV